MYFTMICVKSEVNESDYQKSCPQKSSFQHAALLENRHFLMSIFAIFVKLNPNFFFLPKIPKCVFYIIKHKNHINY